VGRGARDFVEQGVGGACRTACGYGCGAPLPLFSLALCSGAGGQARDPAAAGAGEKDPGPSAALEKGGGHVGWALGSKGHRQGGGMAGSLLGCKTSKNKASHRLPSSDGLPGAEQGCRELGDSPGWLEADPEPPVRGPGAVAPGCCRRCSVRRAQTRARPPRQGLREPSRPSRRRQL